VHQRIGQTGAVPQRKCERPQQRHTPQVEDDILEMVQHSPTTSIERIASRFGTPETVVWRLVHDFGLEPFHIQNIQALQSNDHFVWEEFCHWLLCNQVLCTKMLFTDEVFFNRGGITYKTHTSGLRRKICMQSQKHNFISISH
jgi:hypothetical protein